MKVVCKTQRRLFFFTIRECRTVLFFLLNKEWEGENPGNNAEKPNHMINTIWESGWLGCVKQTTLTDENLKFHFWSCGHIVNHKITSIIWIEGLSATRKATIYDFYINAVY